MSEKEKIPTKQEIPDVFFPAALIAAKHNGKDMRALNLRHKIIRILPQQGKSYKRGNFDVTYSMDILFMIYSYILICL